MTLSLALYQPDIPQNVGAIMRLAACFAAPLHLIAPFGFVWDDAKVRRVAMDYADFANITHHASFETFREKMPGRLILLTTHGAAPYTRFSFGADDVLLLGRESAGVPQAVHEAAAARLFIPMQGGARSLNVGMAAAIVLAEAVRQQAAPGAE